MSEDWYDIAQICTNGHVINSQSVYAPHLNMKFCQKCGTPTITTCQYCSTNIRGPYHTRIGVSGFTRPSFCSNCGQPYPWTEAKITVAHELAEEMENLSAEEKKLLSKSIDDLITDSPRTELAATRFKKILLKVGEPAARALRELIVDIASETAKKLILQ